MSQEWCVLKKQLFFAAALQLTISWVLPAQSTLFQTTTPPSTGTATGGSVTANAFIGNYFVLSNPAHVDTISTAASVSDGGTVFGSILSVPSLGALPTGTPFTGSGTGAPLATAILRPTATNGVVSGSVSVDLPAGNYIVVFGTGQFGATSGIANLAVSDGVRSTLPAGANQVNYGRSCNSGTTDCWSSGFGGPSPFYFSVGGSNGLSNISSLNPNFAAPGSGAFILTVNGTGFQPTSTIGWNGTTLATTFMSATQLTTTVPANLVASGGTASITVTTNGIASSSSTFVIGASSGPSISSVSPNVIAPGSGQTTITVNGAGFVIGAQVLWNGNFLITNSNSATQLTASVSQAYLANPGTATVTVVNPNQATSNSITVVIGQPSSIPTLVSVSPTSATVGSATFNLVVTGTNFTANSAVQWNATLLPTTYLSPTQLSASVNGTLLASAGSANVSVNTQGAGTSNTIAFPIVSNSTPAITSLSPSTVMPNSGAFILTVNGTNFSSGATVTWNGLLLATTFVNSSQLTAGVSATQVLAAGTASVAVLNPGSVASNALTFTISPTPPPVLSSLSPSTAAPGGPNFTLTVNGSNFASNSAILWNGSLQATTVISSSQLSANIPAGLISSAGTANVTVSTPNGGTSAALAFTIAAPTGPMIISLTPSSASPGGSSFILSVNGTGFTPASIVQWNGTQLVTGFVSSTQLQASVSGTLIATAGTANVTVATGTTTSNAVPFTIGAANTPVLSSLSPNSATVGGAQFTLTANGSNFANGATVVWNGGLLSTTFVGATQLTAIVPSSLIAATGSATITVNNPSGTLTTSNPLTFSIATAPSPTISSASPGSIVAGGAQFNLAVNGQGFLQGAVIRWNGATLGNTNFVSATQLTATVPPSLIASPGLATITVANPGGAISNSLSFTIGSSSTSNTLFQTTLPPTPGQPASASLSGGQFLGNYFVLTAPAHIDSISTYAQADFGGTIFGAIIAVNSLTTAPSGNPFDSTVLATALLSPGTTSGIVTAPLSVDLPAGTYVIVFGSQYFGATSTSAHAAFSNGTPVQLPAGWNQVSWGLYCGGVNSCWSANFSSSSQFYFAVTGTSSAPATLSITSLSPSAMTAGSIHPPTNTFDLTINGTGFGSGSTAQLDGTPLATNVLSATQLTAKVPDSLIAVARSASVTVLNGTTISNSVTFTISSPTLSITTLNPPSATAGGTTFTLTVNGSGFANGTTVYWNGSPLTTTFVNATQLTANVPPNLIASAGTASVSVLSPGGQFSNLLQYTIGNGLPIISSVNPNSITAGTGQPLTVLVTGSGFLSTSSVTFNNAAIATSYISATQLSAIIPANLTANPGTFNVTVQNAGGQSVSAPVAFTVTTVGGGNVSAGLAHYAVGSNWTTALFIVNTGATTANYAVSFYDDNGSPAILPFTSGPTNRLAGSLPPYGSLYVEASNPNGALISGWGQISADSSITIQSLFRSTINNTRYEGAVGSSTGIRAFELPFDVTNFSANTPQFTGLAIANMDNANLGQVSCIARDPSGNIIPNGVTIPAIRPLGHWADFRFPNLVGRGTLDCTSTTNVAVIALRFIGSDTFSSLPVIRK